MNKPKAPKDMTATEFVKELERRVGEHPFKECTAFEIRQLREMLTEPTPIHE